MSIDIGNGKLPVDETSRQLFCNLVKSKGELIEKSKKDNLPLAKIWTRVGRDDM